MFIFLYYIIVVLLWKFPLTQNGHARKTMTSVVNQGVTLASHFWKEMNGNTTSLPVMDANDFVKVKKMIAAGSRELNTGRS